jgi:uncharacterized protein (TIGR00725 family)
MGSGAESHEKLAVPLGRWLAEAGFDLLTGAGKGVMAAVSRAFLEVEGRRGLVIGIIPGSTDAAGNYEAPPGYPNPWVELAVRTHLPLSGVLGTDPRSRNHINILTSDVIVVLPGSAGTLSEIELARRYGKPLIAFVGESTFSGLSDGVRIARTLEDVQGFVLDVVETLETPG